MGRHTCGQTVKVALIIAPKVFVQFGEGDRGLVHFRGLRLQHLQIFANLGLFALPQIQAEGPEAESNGFILITPLISPIDLRDASPSS